MNVRETGRVTIMSWLLALPLASCKKPAPGPSPASSQGAAQVSSVRADARPAPSFELGPAAAQAPAAERESRLSWLLRGHASAAELPLAHTDPGAAYAPGQFHELTTAFARGPAPDAELAATATVGTARVRSGVMDQENLQRVVGGMRAAFRACYRGALLDEPSLRGTVALEFTIDRDGHVHEVNIASAPAKSYALKACMRQRGLASIFEPPKSGDSARFQLDVAFTTEPHGPPKSR